MPNKTPEAWALLLSRVVVRVSLTFLGGPHTLQARFYPAGLKR